MPTTITSAGVTFNDTTSLTSANIGTAQLVNGSVTAAKLGTTEQKQIAKAWVNFDGTLATPITPRASYNVSSVTKNGVGDYTVNFATAMADANYSVVTSGTQQGNDINNISNLANPTINAVRIQGYNRNTTYTATDGQYVNVAIFGN